jgi:hypothetical protein
MVGFFMLLLPLTDVLLSTKFFSSLKKAPKDGNMLQGWKRYVAFFGTGTVVSLLAGFLIRYFYLDKWGWGTRFFPLTQRFPQPTTNPVAVWAVALGIIGLLIWLVGYILVGRKAGDQPLEALKIDRTSFWKTVMLTFTIVTGLYITLYIVDGIFKTDFRIWSFDIRTFEAIKIATILTLHHGICSILLHERIHQFTEPFQEYARMGNDSHHCIFQCIRYCHSDDDSIHQHSDPLVHYGNGIWRLVISYCSQSFQS